MKKLIALCLVWVSLALGGCQNETTPSSPGGPGAPGGPGGGSPTEPQPGQAPGER
jgi:hypothetical protein